MASIQQKHQSISIIITISCDEEMCGCWLLRFIHKNIIGIVYATFAVSTSCAAQHRAQKSNGPYTTHGMRSMR